MGANDPNAVIGVYTTATARPCACSTRRPAPPRRPAPTTRCRGWAARWSTRSWCRWRRRTTSTASRRSRTASSRPRSSTPNCRLCFPSSTPAAFPQPGGLHQGPRRPGGHLRHRHPRAASSAPAFGVGTYQGGKVIAEMLRLNMGIAPTSSDGTQAGTSNLGLLGNDLAGFPNGRRPTDDVVTIELKAVAGATIPLVDKTYTADEAVAVVNQGVTPSPRAYQAASRTWPTRTVGSPTRRPRRPTTPTPSSRRRGEMTITEQHHHIRTPTGLEAPYVDEGPTHGPPEPGPRHRRGHRRAHPLCGGGVPRAGDRSDAGRCAAIATTCTR